MVCCPQRRWSSDSSGCRSDSAALADPLAPKRVVGPRGHWATRSRCPLAPELAGPRGDWAARSRCPAAPELAGPRGDWAAGWGCCLGGLQDLRWIQPLLLQAPLLGKQRVWPQLGHQLPQPRHDTLRAVAVLAALVDPGLCDQRCVCLAWLAEYVRTQCLLLLAPAETNPAGRWLLSASHFRRETPTFQLTMRRSAIAPGAVRRLAPG